MVRPALSTAPGPSSTAIMAWRKASPRVSAESARWRRNKSVINSRAEAECTDQLVTRSLLSSFRLWTCALERVATVGLELFHGGQWGPTSKIGFVLLDAARSKLTSRGVGQARQRGGIVLFLR